MAYPIGAQSVVGRIVEPFALVGLVIGSWVYAFASAPFVYAYKKLKPVADQRKQ